jgi:DNA-binding response OmpR family regulator
MDDIRVLVVDDSEDQAELLARYFERAGCTVEVVGTGEAAVVSYRECSPHVAVIDLQLPGMNGWELSGRLRIERPEVAIVITSVLDQREFPQAHAALPKPFTGAQVRSTLAAVLPDWMPR